MLPIVSWNMMQANGLCYTCNERLGLQMGEQYPETIKVLIDLYTAFIDDWTSYNNNVRDGVAILHEANTLGWELDYVRTKWTEDLEEIPGHVIAKRI